MGIVNKLYYASPVYMQEALIYLKSGLMAYKFSKPDSSTPIFDCINQADVVRENIESMLHYATKNVPYYRDYIRERGLVSEDINISNFREILPIVSKKELRKNPESFNTCIAKHRNISISTSGTTGQPMRILTNKEDRAKNYKYFNALISKYNVKPFSRSVTIAGKKVGSERQRNKIYRHDRFSNTLFMSNYDISQDTIEQYISTLLAYDPEFIDSYPYPIVRIAKYMQSRGIKYSAKSLKVILTSSESLDNASRELITNVFKCPVIDQYGNAEMAAFGYDVGQGFYFPGSYALTEFIPNVKGRYDIIATSSINRGTPIIRFNTGDEVNLVLESEMCYSLVDKVVGRVEDPIVLSNGELLTQFNPVSGVDNIESAQVVQMSDGVININIIPGAGFTKEHLRRVKDNAALKLIGKATYKCQLVQKNELTKNGKFKFIINKMDKSGIKM